MTITLANSILSASLQTSIFNLREKIGETGQEAVTGYYSDLTLKLNGDIGQAQLLQKALTDIDLEQEMLTIRQTRLNIGQDRLMDVAEATDTIANDMRVAISMEDPFSLEVGAQDAGIMLESVFTSLSVRVGQRFLFSGDTTDQPPLADSSQLLDDVRTMANNAIDEADFETQMDTYFNDPAGGFRTNIYLGSDTNSDPDSITATEDSLVTLMRGLATIAMAHPDTGADLVRDSDTLITHGADLIDGGRTQLTLTQAELGRLDSRIIRDLEILDSDRTIITANFTQLTVRDQYEAATELQQLETNLEAAYLLTAKLTELSIINFIR